MVNFYPNFDETEPRAGFLAGLQGRLGTDPFKSIYGRFQAAQQAPYQTAFSFNQLLNPPAQGASNPFQSFVAGQGLQNVRDLSRNLFGQLSGGSAPAAVTQQFAQPDEDQASQLRNLAVTALMSRISPLALGLLNIPTGADLRDRFLAASGGDPNTSFINYVKAQLGLGMI
jgi:hypothetical protein